MKSSSKKAIIIGAGPAGLTAAYCLLKETAILPVIFEESGDIGGISKTINHHGNRIDIGGHRFFSKNKDVLRLWFTLMPEQGVLSMDDILLHRERSLAQNGPDPNKTDNVMLIRTRVSRIFYLRKFFDYPISLKLQTFINMGLFRMIHAGLGYLLAIVHKRKENSLEDFYINRFGKPLYQMFFEDYTEKLWGVHPSKIAPDWGAQRIKGLSITTLLLNVLTKPFRKKDSKVETSLIEQFHYPKFGPGHYYEILAQEIEKMGGEIIRNAKVSALQTDGSKIVSVTINDSETVAADYIISSMPIKDLVSGIQSPAITTEVREIASALPYRDFITVGLLLKKLKLKNQTKMPTIGDIVPDCWIYVQERDVKIGRIQIFNNWSPYMVKDFENNIWIGLEYFCTENDAHWNMPDEEFISFAIDELVKIDVIDREDVIDSVRIKIKKAYPAYFGAYKKFDLVREYLDSIENLYCVGRNGQHRYNNMDHSMLTAMEAVKIIKTSGSSKDTIWDVNTEEEYHEENRKAT